MFTETVPGCYVLTASKTRLAGWLGIHRNSLSDRLRTLSRVGAVVASDPVTLDLEILEQSGNSNVVPLRPPSHPDKQIRGHGTHGPSSADPPAHGRCSGPNTDHTQLALAEGGNLIALLGRLCTTVRHGSWTSSEDPRLLAIVELATAAAEQLAAAPPQSPPGTNSTPPSETSAPIPARRSPNPVSVAEPVAQSVASTDFRRTDGLPFIEPDSEPEVSGQHQRNRHEALKSVAKSVASADSAALPGLPADRRDLSGFGSIPDWDPSDWDELVRPAEEAWRHKTGEFIRIANRSIVTSAQRWPRMMVQGAVDRLVGDIQANHQLIDNPGAILCQALRQGWYRYLPPCRPDADTNGAALVDQLREIATRWRHQANDEDYPTDLLAECLYGAYGRPECRAVPRLAVALRSVAQCRPEIMELYATSFAHVQGISSVEQLLSFIRDECHKAGLSDEGEASTAWRDQAGSRSTTAVTSGSKRSVIKHDTWADNPPAQGNRRPESLSDCLPGWVPPASDIDEFAQKACEPTQESHADGEVEPPRPGLRVLPLELRRPDERATRRRAGPLRPAELGILDRGAECERPSVGGGRV
ncbi:MAG: hypothetical protein M3O70_29075 [Actinomycetota bacterium]|nr:hypothetical protein [Actinomycetota bacterium]